MFARLLMPKFSTKFRPRNEPGCIVLDVDVMLSVFFAKWHLAKKNSNGKRQKTVAAASFSESNVHIKQHYRVWSNGDNFYQFTENVEWNERRNKKVQYRNSSREKVSWNLLNLTLIYENELFPASESLARLRLFSGTSSWVDKLKWLVDGII